MFDARRPKALITGTPGVGKTTHCRKLAAFLNTKCISVGELLAGTPYVTYIPELDTYEIVDLDGAVKRVHSVVEPGHIIDTHVVELVPDPEVVIVQRKAPDVLFAELKRRGWPLKKILDNVWAEILDVVLIKARERWGEVAQIDVTRRRPEETFELLKKCVAGGRCHSDVVDWLGYSEESGFLEFIERLSRSESF
ncbi:MAG: adenylate kinase family protein [Pyrobaculum sp.]